MEIHLVKMMGPVLKAADPQAAEALLGRETQARLNIIEPQQRDMLREKAA